MEAIQRTSAAVPWLKVHRLNAISVSLSYQKRARLTARFFVCESSCSGMPGMMRVH
jgi:hypothetical protein